LLGGKDLTGRFSSYVRLSSRTHHVSLLKTGSYKA
jgi:hypothetical protein